MLAKFKNVETRHGASLQRLSIGQNSHNIAAQAVYQGLGFQLLPEKYGLLIFKDESE